MSVYYVYLRYLYPYTYCPLPPTGIPSSRIKGQSVNFK
nr:MAG TPA: hypothetical protein [Caudoviricetes sp.]DAY52764.1 MAG TPA: hypothetical protein [Caudoviricetes sp.]